jgi:hypothetical protein
MTEEEIIATGLSLIKQGVLTSDWDKVCEGYKGILGEDLQPPKKEPVSRLSKIKNLIAEADNNKKVKDRKEKKEKRK